MKKDIFFQTPDSVSRCGEHIFIQCPLFRSKSEITPIYINESLFREIFDESSHNREEMFSFIKQTFSITLNREKSTGEQIGWAYIDRQVDPLEISLLGNLGSGRAYYTGRYFNIKGEKTPLATSHDAAHASGVLSMIDAIHSTIAANSFYEEMETGLAPVLAILDLGEDYQSDTLNNSKPIKMAKIIRIDKSGSLDRVSHLFVNPHRTSNINIQKSADRFGKLEAEKIIHRLLHGSWSVGNISPQGHLIDFDTVCAVKGRQPQYCSSRYYSENYFGFENRAQLKVLQCIIDDPRINHENIELEIASKQLVNSLRINIARKLPYLIGFEQHEEIYQHYADTCIKLADMFLHLSRKTRYKTDKSFYTNYPLHFLAHIFDFSSLFRTYPILKMHQTFSIEIALKLLFDHDKEIDENALDSGYFYQEEPVQDRVYDIIKDDIVNNADQLRDLHAQAVHFIKSYDALYDEIIHKNHIDENLTSLRAYVINEDRFYLFSLFDLSYSISKSDFSPSDINDLINTLITASKRNPVKTADKVYISDIRLFKNGKFYITLSQDGYFQIIFELKMRSLPENQYKSSDFTIEFNNKLYSTQLKIKNNNLIIMTDKIGMFELGDHYTRSSVFIMEKYKIYYEKSKFIMGDYFLDRDGALNYLDHDF